MAFYWHSDESQHMLAYFPSAESVLAAPDSQRKSEGLWIINYFFMKKERRQGNEFIGCLLCVRNSILIQQVLNNIR